MSDQKDPNKNNNGGGLGSVLFVLMLLFLLWIGLQMAGIQLGNYFNR